MMKKARIPQLYLEQALLDELPEEKKGLLNSGEAQSRLEELEASNREILLKYDPARMAERIRSRLESEGADEARSADAGAAESRDGTAGEAQAGKKVIRREWFTRHRFGVMLAAAALTVFAGTSPFLFRSSPAVDTVAPGTEITRIKGMDPEISLYRKTGDAVEELSNGAVARESDLIQISYNAAGRPFGAIFSIDGRGVVTLHFPDNANGSIVLERDGEVALDFSYRLDDAPHFERFFFVTSDRTFDVDTVLKAARVLSGRLMRENIKLEEGPLELPDGLAYMSVTLKKEVSE